MSSEVASSLLGKATSSCGAASAYEAASDFEAGVLVRLPQLVRLSHLMTQPYLGWQPSPTSIPHLGSQPRFILASLPLAVITGVHHSWVYGPQACLRCLRLCLSPNPSLARLR